MPDTSAEPRPIIPTGNQPPGPLHLGRVCGSLRDRVALQHDHDPFVQIADGQALTDDAGKAGLITRHMLALALNELVVGIDPNFTTICLRPAPPALCEPTRLFLDLVTVGPFVCNPTIEEENQTYSFGYDIPSGCACYQVAQTADIAPFRATLVPVGADQAPMIEQADEIVLCLNRQVGQAQQPEARAPIPESRRLPGVGGRAEMSTSQGNALALSATKDEIRAAVRRVDTNPDHPRVTDLCAFDADRDTVAALKSHDRRGSLSDTVVEQRVETVLLDLVAPIRARRLGRAPERCRRHCLGRHPSRTRHHASDAGDVRGWARPVPLL